MKILVDTHVFIWWDADPTRLSPSALSALQDPANEIWVSVVSLWEIVIKEQLGKLTLRIPLEQLVADQQANGFQMLPILPAHALAISTLPLVHRDPFDRMLAAQTIVEQATLLSADPIFASYPVAGLW